MSDLIDRQAAIDVERNATVDTNPSHFVAHQKFTQFMDDEGISSFGRWQWANGFNTALTAVGIDLKKLPSAQPERKERNMRPIDDLREKIDLWKKSTADTALMSVLNDVLKQIDVAIQEMDHQEAESPWHRVEDVMPHGQELVIVAVKDTAGDTPFWYTACGWVTTDGEYWIVDNEICDYVVAWMPLPEPPKDDADANK